MTKSNKPARSRAVLGLAAAAGLSAFALAGQASAADTFTLVSASMDTNYTAYINGFGYAYASPVTFQISGYPGDANETSLFGFCFDIYHDMYLGSLDYTYTTNQPEGGGLIANAPQTLTNSGGASPLDPLNQISAITNLVDTGYILHQQENGANYADTETRLAAIQTAIWNVEQPGIVSQFSGGAGNAFATYFAQYSTGNYVSLAAPTDKVFTIQDGTHQSFAIGWPVGVPEPATWALMLSGFGMAGAMLRSQRKAAATA